jgi:hypothetical protein
MLTCFVKTLQYLLRFAGDSAMMASMCCAWKFVFVFDELYCMLERKVKLLFNG